MDEHEQLIAEVVKTLREAPMIGSHYQVLRPGLLAAGSVGRLITDHEVAPLLAFSRPTGLTSATVEHYQVRVPWAALALTDAATTSAQGARYTEGAPCRGQCRQHTRTLNFDRLCDPCWIAIVWRPARLGPWS